MLIYLTNGRKIIYTFEIYCIFLMTQIVSVSCRFLNDDQKSNYRVIKTSVKYKQLVKENESR